ncbi:DUF2793 domain-containing protein [Allosphingosinicella indica]|uniref:DUF2793 domain-containing protein n=1 Tax=Allosphingosinicella indica TaxID=941907 RepID=A0A1X7GDE0_9SPHN|nr:DUF2793 domain-containing protein [Allosphingosinicella indica]SMF68147.1 Protein of unknown function [Allosphingosinicella indica]
MATTPRFALPHILPGQAQKELFHNEALARIDAALHASVIEPPRNAPPAAPAAGDCWIVGSTPSGAWSGQAHALAAWTEGGWRFVAPRPGMQIWEDGEGRLLRWTGATWESSICADAIFVGGVQVVGSRLAEIATPSGGTIIDAEARSAVEEIIVALKSHGLID